MTAEFTAALEQLALAQDASAGTLIEQLSAPEPDDVALFRQRFPRLAEATRLGLIGALVDRAETDFELDFTELFRVALEDDAPAVRCRAVEGLWEDDRLDLLRRFLGLLEQDPSDEVRAAAASSLGRFVFMAECELLDAVRSARLRSALETAVAQQSLEVARRALESLAYINDQSVTQLIDSAYAHSHPHMRQSAVFAMGRSADRFWTETVLAELHSDDPALRYEAARASGELKLSRAVPTLVQLISRDPDPEVQSMAIWSLGEIGGTRAREVLERLVESENEARSAAAQEALDSLDLGTGEFDMFVFEGAEGQEWEGPHAHAHPHAEDDADDEDESDQGDAGEELLGYRRDFAQYLDEDDDSTDDDLEDEEWPDDPDEGA